MYYYAYIDENNIVTGTYALPSQITADGYIEITEAQYNSGDLVGKVYDPETGDFNDPVTIDWVCKTTEVQCVNENGEGTGVQLSTKINAIDTDISGKAPLNHSHEGYALTDHTHDDYALTDHTHTGYASSDHTHSGYASSTHTHSEYALSNHNHDTEYAATNHNHNEDYSPLNHNHNSEYSPLNHTHSEYVTGEKNATLTVAGWNGTEAPYTQTVTVDGITSSTKAIADLSMSATAEQRDIARKALLKVTAQGTNSVTVTADGKLPTVALPITLLLV